MKVKDLGKLLSKLPQEASCSITLYDDGTPLQIGVPSSKNKPESAPKASPGAKPKVGNPNVLSATEKKNRNKRLIDIVKKMNDTGGDVDMAAKAIIDEFQVSKQKAAKAVNDVTKKYSLDWSEDRFKSDDPMNDLKTV